MTAAFPRTSRPTKSAGKPVPTHTGSSSTEPLVPTDAYNGNAVLMATLFSAPAAVISHDVGNHCGGSVNSCTWICSRPMRLYCAATQSVVILSYGVPAIRPQY